MYLIFIEEKQIPSLYILDQRYSYGCEFYGAQTSVELTPLTDKCFLSMSQAVAGNKGAMLTGETAAGKTETVKVGNN